MNFTQQLEEAREYGITPLCLIENVLPVVNGAREISALSLGSSEYMESLEHMRDYLIRSYGLDIFRLYLHRTSDNNGLSWVYFFREGDQGTIDKIDTLGEMVDSGKYTDLFLWKSEGSLLGYPECCVSMYEIRKKLYPHGYGESIRNTQDLANGAFVVHTPSPDSPSSIQVTRDIIPSFFTAGFHPCKPDCENAIALGNRILDSMQEGARGAYEMALLNNTLFASLDGASMTEEHAVNPENDVNNRKMSGLATSIIENKPLFPGVPIEFV